MPLCHMEGHETNGDDPCAGQCGCARLRFEGLPDRARLLLLEIPTYSPDINVIERLWIHLKRRVSARYPTRKDDLKKIVLEEFAAIPQSTIDGICNGFENAIDKVIEQKGQPFKSRK